MKKNLICLVSIIAVMGCATPYQKAGWRGGYTDSPLGGNRYLVTFEGNGMTSHDRVQKGALTRAQEICTEKGFAKINIQDIQSGDTVHRFSNSVNTNCIKNGNQYNCQSQQPSEFTKHKVSLIAECQN